MSDQRTDDLQAMSLSELSEWLSAPQDWARSAMVISLTGRHLDAAGSSRGLSGPDDLRVLQTLRAGSDVTLVGRRTAVQEGYVPGRLPADLRRPGRPRPRLAVVSRDLALPADGPLHQGEHPVIVFTEERDDPTWERAASTLPSGFQLEVCPSPITGAMVRARLRSLGLTRVLCEGGPSVQEMMRADGSIDEICLSVSHSLAGHGEPIPGAFGQTAARYLVAAVATSPFHTVLRLRLQSGAPTLVA